MTEIFLTILFGAALWLVRHWEKQTIEERKKINNMNTVYNVDYFINKFQAIPEDKIINHRLSDENGNHCANGWCINDSQNFETDEVRALGFLFTGKMAYSTMVANINNGQDKRYQQPTPKQRILAALYDIKKMQYPELSETTVNDLISEKEFHNPYS